MKKIWIGLIVIILIACGGYYAYLQNHKKTEKANTNNFANRNVYTVKRDSLVKSISASGNLTPVKEKDLQFLNTGIVKDVTIKAGDRVKKGQVLASLENLENELSLAKAWNSYEEAKINASPTVQEERRMELQIAEKKYRNAQLTAPFSGLVTTFDIESNDQVSGSGVVGHMIDDSRYVMELNIDEADIFSLAVGQKAIVQLDSHADVKLNGEVTFISSTASTEGGVVAFPIKVEVGADHPMVKSGLSATAEIVVAEEQNVLVVPITSVIQRGKNTIVMKIVDGKPTPAPVKKGTSNDSMVVILEGLEEGDQIVLNNSEVINELRQNSQNAQSRNRQQNIQMMPGMSIPTGNTGRR